MCLKPQESALETICTACQSPGPHSDWIRLIRGLPQWRLAVERQVEILIVYPKESDPGLLCVMRSFLSLALRLWGRKDFSLPFKILLAGLRTKLT